MNSMRRKTLRYKRQLERAKKIFLKIPVRIKKDGTEILDLSKALGNETLKTKKYVIFGGKY